MPKYDGLKQAVIVFNDLDKVVGVEMQKIPEGSAEKWHVGLTYLDAGSVFKLGAFMKNKAEADKVIADVEAANP